MTFGRKILSMKRLPLSLVAIVLMSGCKVFEVPRTDPDLQNEPWAADAVRKAKASDAEAIESDLRRGRTADDRP